MRAAIAAQAIIEAGHVSIIEEVVLGDEGSSLIAGASVVDPGDLVEELPVALAPTGWRHCGGLRKS